MLKWCQRDLSKHFGSFVINAMNCPSRVVFWHHHHWCWCHLWIVLPATGWIIETSYLAYIWPIWRVLQVHVQMYGPYGPRPKAFICQMRNEIKSTWTNFFMNSFQKIDLWLMYYLIGQVRQRTHSLWTSHQSLVSTVKWWMWQWMLGCGNMVSQKASWRRAVWATHVREHAWITRTMTSFWLSGMLWCQRFTRNLLMMPWLQ